MADLVPGVSGGTVALILGVYEALIQAISSFKKSSLFFLLKVVGGVGMALFCLSTVLHAWLEQPISRALLFSAFFGFILGSIWFVKDRVARWNKKVVFALLVGTICACLLTQSPHINFDATPYSLFLAGMLAVSAMLLPGISGSYIYVLLGLYPAIISALARRDIWFLLPLGCGVCIGAVLFSQLIQWLLEKYHDITMGALVGFMLGSLGAIWPYQQGVDSFWVSTTIVLSFFVVFLVEVVAKVFYRSDR